MRTIFCAQLIISLGRGKGIFRGELERFFYVDRHFFDRLKLTFVAELNTTFIY